MGHNQSATRRQRAFVDALVRLGDPLKAYCESYGYESNPVGDARRQLARRVRIVTSLPAVAALLADMQAKGHVIPDMASTGAPSPRQVIELLRRMSHRGSEAMAPLSADDLFQLESAAAELHELVSAELGRRRRSTRLRRAKRAEAATLTETASSIPAQG